MHERYSKITDPFKFEAEKKKEKLRQPKPDIRLSIDFNCFTKRNMFTGFAFIYLLLLNVIGFGYCNHWKLTFRLAKRRFVYNWFGMVLARKCDNLRIKSREQYFLIFGYVLMNFQ